MVENIHKNKEVVIIGAGPAGLSGAYELSKLGIPSVVLERDDIVGGISRTERYKGFHFDIGGHRFFTKVKAVEDMWHEVLPQGEFITCSRLSRIYYNKKFFYYPLRPTNALLGLGMWNSVMIVLSYLWAQQFPELPEENFERWVSNRFGKRLYRIFFKTYTEKVWGMPANEIDADWAAQRIKGLSLLVAIKNSLLAPNPNGDKQAVVKTLIDSFEYPKRGPGMMWEAVTEHVKAKGGRVHMKAEVEKVIWSRHRVDAVEARIDGERKLLKGTHFINSMPIRTLIQKMEPAVPDEVLAAANSLKYRDFLTVALVINKEHLFPDNWIYIHDSGVKVGRIQNFKNWSQEMVPDSSKTCLGLEYFCFEGDGLWSMPDQELVELGRRELNHLGLGRAEDVEDGVVVRMPKAYPVYDSEYRGALATIREFLDPLENFQVVGRNGMHKYNNQDHSMLTAMLAVKNILGEKHDLWEVNVEQEYHEEVTEKENAREESKSPLGSTQPLVPEKLVALTSVDEALVKTFSRMDKFGFATAIGTVSGLMVWIATMWLVLKGGDVVGPNLELLSQYFVGYTVTATGAFIGLAYSFSWGFLWGWLFAYLRNFFLGFTIFRVKRRMEMMAFREFLEQF